MDEFLGAIGLFAFDVIPKHWLPCDGRMMSVPQNQALFALLGVKYGGDGKTTFGLPDLRGRAIVGSSPAYLEGTRGGVENATLATGQVPSHYHNIAASTMVGNSTVLEGSVIAASASTPNLPSPPPIYAPTGMLVAMGTGSVGSTGGNVPHNNMQPFQVLSYCICVLGQYPSTN